MVDSHPPFDLDPRHPNFSRDCLLWSLQTMCEIRQLVDATKRSIDGSRALIAEADRVLARQSPIVIAERIVPQAITRFTARRFAP